MITADGLKEANGSLNNIEIERRDKKTGKVTVKKYAPVTERIRAFRQMCPGGSIHTDLVSMEGGIVTMQATIMDEEGRVISTGLAQEKESNGFINATSYIENCETSAVGRALGFAGIGIDESMASAEEVANAMKQQEDIKNKKKNNDLIPSGKPVDDERLQKLVDEITRTGSVESKICAAYNIKDLRDLTEAQYISAMNRLEKMPTKGA